ncbi:MAG: hypothetical protein SWX82_18110 [Cyanobacteriota bacterium]|nr:hypothetical protein [Cyanobacteriota bacterium]
MPESPYGDQLSHRNIQWRSPLTQNQPTTKKHDKHNNHCPNLHPKTSHLRGQKEQSPEMCRGEWHSPAQIPIILSKSGIGDRSLSPHQPQNHDQHNNHWLPNIPDMGECQKAPTDTNHPNKIKI